MGLFAFLVVVWGGSFIAVKVGIETIPPIQLAVFRYGIGAVIMLSYVLLLKKYRYPVNRRDWSAVGICGLFLFTLYPISLHIGQQFVEGNIASVVAALIPVFTPGIALALIPSERLHMREILGIILGFFGAVLVVQPSLTSVFDSRMHGFLLLICSSTVFAFGGVMVKRIQAPLPSVTLVAWSAGMGVPLLILYSHLRGELPVTAIQWNFDAVVATLFLGVAVTGIGYFVYFELIEEMSPTYVNLSGYLMPVSAAVVGWIWLHESITLMTIVGFIVIFLGFYLIRTKELRQEFARSYMKIIRLVEPR